MNATAEKTSVTPSRIAGIFWNQTKRHPLFVILTVAGVVVDACAAIFIPLSYKKFFDALAVGGVPNPELIAVAAGALIVVFSWIVARWFAWRLSNITASRVEPGIMAELATTAFAGLIRHSYEFFSNSFVGSLVRRVNRFAQAYETVADQIIYSFTPLLVALTGILIVVWTRSPSIALFMLAWTIGFLYVSYLAVVWKQKFELERSEADSKFTGTLSDSVTNSFAVRSFSRVAHEASIVGTVAENLRRIRQKTWLINEGIRAAQGFLTVLVEIGVMVGAFYFFKQGSLTVGDFVLFQSYIITLTNHIWGFGWVLKNMFQAFADATEMVEILDKPYDVQDAPGAKPLVVSNGAIEFEHVDFSFNETRAVLKDFTLTIAPGERVAFVGSSGAGKSTITKLLFRFYDVTDGAIVIDGQNIAHVTQETLRDSIALVPQESVLFHRSLMDNIRYGRLSATDEEVYEAAKKARCFEFIDALPDGFNTLVGERGIKLSGGERQRVAIARAILKNAPILVLDEATSSLDSESEALIQEALAELMHGKTTLVIAHRLSTIIRMDRIVVLEAGQILDAGSHQELLGRNDLYKRLWSIQAGGFLGGAPVEVQKKQ